MMPSQEANAQLQHAPQQVNSPEKLKEQIERIERTKIFSNAFIKTLEKVELCQSDQELYKKLTQDIADSNQFNFIQTFFTSYQKMMKDFNSDHIFLQQALNKLKGDSDPSASISSKNSDAIILANVSGDSILSNKNIFTQLERCERDIDDVNHKVPNAYLPSRKLFWKLKLRLIIDQSYFDSIINAQSKPNESPILLSKEKYIELLKVEVRKLNKKLDSIPLHESILVKFAYLDCLFEFVRDSAELYGLDQKEIINQIEAFIMSSKCDLIQQYSNELLASPLLNGILCNKKGDNFFSHFSELEIFEKFLNDFKVYKDLISFFPNQNKEYKEYKELEIVKDHFEALLKKIELAIKDFVDALRNESHLAFDHYLPAQRFFWELKYHLYFTLSYLQKLSELRGSEQSFKKKYYLKEIKQIIKNIKIIKNQIIEEIDSIPFLVNGLMVLENLIFTSIQDFSDEEKESLQKIIEEEIKKLIEPLKAKNFKLIESLKEKNSEETFQEKKSLQKIIEEEIEKNKLVGMLCLTAIEFRSPIYLRYFIDLLNEDLFFKLKDKFCFRSQPFIYSQNQMQIMLNVLIPEQELLVNAIRCVECIEKTQCYSKAGFLISILDIFENNSINFQKKKILSCLEKYFPKLNQIINYRAALRLQFPNDSFNFEQIKAALISELINTIENLSLSNESIELPLLVYAIQCIEKTQCYSKAGFLISILDIFENNSIDFQNEKILSCLAKHFPELNQIIGFRADLRSKFPDNSFNFEQIKAALISEFRKEIKNLSLFQVQYNDGDLYLPLRQVIVMQNWVEGLQVFAQAPNLAQKNQGTIYKVFSGENENLFLKENNISNFEFACSYRCYTEIANLIKTGDFPENAHLLLAYDDLGHFINELLKVTKQEKRIVCKEFLLKALPENLSAAILMLTGSIELNPKDWLEIIDKLPLVIPNNVKNTDYAANLKDIWNLIIDHISENSIKFEQSSFLSVLMDKYRAVPEEISEDKVISLSKEQFIKIIKTNTGNITDKLYSFITDIISKNDKKNLWSMVAQWLNWLKECSPELSDFWVNLKKFIDNKFITSPLLIAGFYKIKNLDNETKTFIQNYNPEQYKFNAENEKNSSFKKPVTHVDNTQEVKEQKVIGQANADNIVQVEGNANHGGQKNSVEINKPDVSDTAQNMISNILYYTHKDCLSSNDSKPELKLATVLKESEGSFGTLKSDFVKDQINLADHSYILGLIKESDIESIQKKIAEFRNKDNLTVEAVLFRNVEKYILERLKEGEYKTTFTVCGYTFFNFGFSRKQKVGAAIALQEYLLGINTDINELKPHLAALTQKSLFHDSNLAKNAREFVESKFNSKKLNSNAATNLLDVGAGAQRH